jgi:hypothetical protein
MPNKTLERARKRPKYKKTQGSAKKPQKTQKRNKRLNISRPQKTGLRLLCMPFRQLLTNFHESCTVGRASFHRTREGKKVILPPTLLILNQNSLI